MSDHAVLERVAEYRRAARLAVTAPVDEERRRYLALLDLADAARAEDDPTVRAWAERAIWEESKMLLGVDDTVQIPEPYERAQRRLRAQGLETCPTCRAAIAAEADLQRWARIRLADAERRDAHERAVQP